jgi:DNA anti-recombination protein RmuC
MTDNELIKTLEVISDTANCHECGFYDGNVHNCAQIVAQNSLDLINRLKAENEDLEIKLKHFAEFLAEAEKKNEELKAENEELITIIFTDRSEAIKLLKTEAIKEFAERLKEYSKWYSYVTPRDIDNLVKEMVGEDE